MTYEQMFEKLAGRGGLVAHLGTNSAIEVEQRIEAGDEHARLIYEAMAYQIAKEIGAMATVLRGRWMPSSSPAAWPTPRMLLDWIEERVAWIAPLLVYPGEDEMLALAQGALRVLTGEERARDYRGGSRWPAFRLYEIRKTRIGKTWTLQNE